MMTSIRQAKEGERMCYEVDEMARWDQRMLKATSSGILKCEEARSDALGGVVNSRAERSSFYGEVVALTSDPAEGRFTLNRFAELARPRTPQLSKTVWRVASIPVHPRPTRQSVWPYSQRSHL